MQSDVGLGRLVDLADDPNVAFLSEHDPQFKAIWSQPRIQQEIAARKLVHSLRNELMDIELVQDAIRTRIGVDAAIHNRALELAADPAFQISEEEVFSFTRRKALTPGLPRDQYESAAQLLTRSGLTSSTAAQVHRQAIRAMLAYRMEQYQEAESVLRRMIEFASDRDWMPIYSAFAAMAAARQGRQGAPNDLAAMEVLSEYTPPSDRELVEKLATELAEVTGSPVSPRSDSDTGAPSGGQRDVKGQAGPQ
jgi:hypothetical protein